MIVPAVLRNICEKTPKTIGTFRDLVGRPAALRNQPMVHAKGAIYGKPKITAVFLKGGRLYGKLSVAAKWALMRLSPLRAGA